MRASYLILAAGIREKELSAVGWWQAELPW